MTYFQPGKGICPQSPPGYAPAKVACEHVLSYVIYPACHRRRISIDVNRQPSIVGFVMHLH